MNTKADVFKRGKRESPAKKPRKGVGGDSLKASPHNRRIAAVILRAVKGFIFVAIVTIFRWYSAIFYSWLRYSVLLGIVSINVNRWYSAI